MKSRRTASIILSAIILVIGVLMLIKPGASMNVICWIIGIGLCIGGVVGIISGLRLPELGFFKALYLAGGIIALIAGLIFLINPEFIIALFPILFGISVAINGVINLYNAFQVRVISDHQWLVPVGLAILTIALGVLIFANPFGTMELLVRIIGIVLIYNAASNIYIWVKLK